VARFFQIIFKNYTLREAVRAEIEEDIGFIVRNLPGLIGNMARYLAYKPLFKRIDSFPFIHPGVRFVFMSQIELGKSVLINSNTYLYGKGGIQIGDQVLISPNCSIIAGDHQMEPGCPVLERPTIPAKIVVEKDSWIGANSVVVGGVTIREGSIIGAGSVVTKDTEPYSISVGVPAKKIGERKVEKGRDVNY
jgi:acetyltransferase-like isoleucine patch superfamily enzyme